MLTMLQEKRIYFDRTTTSMIKGVALIMMFIHHFFTIPSFWTGSVSYPLLETLAPYINAPFKMCVPVFCFITGYFYYFHTDKSYRYSLKKITDIFIVYIVVFTVLAIAAVCFAGYTYTVSAIITEVFAISRPTMYFCWYIPFYYACMLFLPVFSRLQSPSRLVNCVVCFIFIPFVIRAAYHFFPIAVFGEALESMAQWFPCVGAGYFFACYGWLENPLEKINNHIVKSKGINVILWILLAAAASMCRTLKQTVITPIPVISVKYAIPALTLNLDVFYAPVFIYSAANLCKCFRGRFIAPILSGIGKYSLSMWFVHCIFFNNSKEVFQPVLYFPHNPVLVLIWGLLLCYILSIMLDPLIKRMILAKNKSFAARSITGGKAVDKIVE